MGIDDLIRKIEVHREYIEKLRKGEIDKDAYCVVYGESIKEQEKEANKIKEEIVNYEHGVIYLKRGFAELFEKLSKIQTDWFNFYEGDNKYIRKRTFEEDIKDYDRTQKKIEESKGENQ